MEDLCYKGADAVAFPVYRSLKLPLTTFVDELTKEDGTISRFTLQTVTIVKGLRPFNHCPQKFSEKSSPPRTAAIEITGLGYELASRQAFSQIDGRRGADVEKWIRESANGGGGRYSRLDETLLPGHGMDGVVNLPHRCSASSQFLTREDVRDSIQRLWYNAKNRVYTNEQYYQEIERMQSRLDFSRTVAVISLLVEALSLFFILMAEYAHLANEAGATIQLGVQWRRHSWYRCGIFFAIFIAATVAYTRESLEINKRVYGYYSSILSQENRSAAQTPAGPRATSLDDHDSDSIRRSNSRSAEAISLFSTFALRKLRLTVNGSALSFTCQVKFFGRPAFFASGFAVCLRTSSRVSSPAA
jgi:hypothetical protein